MRRLAILVVALAACGGSDDGLGEPGTYQIAGTIQYEDRAPLPSGDLATAMPKPARGISVAVIAEDDGMTLVTGTTDDTGAYALEFDGISGEKIHILAVATSAAPNRPIDVTDSENALHGFGGASIQAGVDTDHDVLITIASDAAEAFNIFDTLVDVMDRIPAAFGSTTPPKLVAVWERGSVDGTYFDGRAMHLLGASDDNDGFDDTVIMHEAGHYIEDKLGRSDSPGGSHGGEPVNPTLAWSEGFSTYFAMAVRNSPIYMDSNADGGWSYNGDTSITRASEVGLIGQNVSEDMITEILWDMGDADAGDDDPLTTDTNHDLVLSLEPFLKSAALRQIGKAGVDLVDALDGWFINEGLTSCDAMRTIISRHTFPYDFLATGAACPAPL
ncbi:MAG: hypothetical protein ABI867_32450 [Kofleriaceae bacterium]